MLSSMCLRRASAGIARIQYRNESETQYLEVMKQNKEGSRALWRFVVCKRTHRVSKVLTVRLPVYILLPFMNLGGGGSNLKKKN